MRNSRKNVSDCCSGGGKVRLSDNRSAFHERPLPRDTAETTRLAGEEVGRPLFARDLKKLRREDSKPRISVAKDKILPNVPAGVKLPRGFIKRLKSEYEPMGIFDEDGNEKAELVKRRMMERLTDSEFWIVVQFAELNGNYSALARLYGVSQPTATRWMKRIVKKIIS